jgi:hypothetical protein
MYIEGSNFELFSQAIHLGFPANKPYLYALNSCNFLRVTLFGFLINIVLKPYYDKRSN